MNTLNGTNLTLGIIGFTAAGFFGLTLLENTGGEAIGIVIAYVAALAIAAVAGTDANRNKKLG
jgi:hypothetical protein